jgi:hypothetical protein
VSLSPLRCKRVNSSVAVSSLVSSDPFFAVSFRFRSLRAVIWSYRAVQSAFGRGLVLR